MASRPVTGIARTVSKYTGRTPAQYNGIARAGELVIDLDDYAVYLGKEDGSLTLIRSNSGTTGYYGTFYSTITQTNPVANTAIAVTYNATNLSNGVSIVDNSKITMAHAGIYNIQFSLQVDKTDPGEDIIDLWLSKNGVNVNWTNTSVSLPKTDSKFVAAWNFVEEAAPGDYFQIMWASADTSMRIYARPPTTNPDRPGIPSVILTVTEN